MCKFYSAGRGDVPPLLRGVFFLPRGKAFPLGGKVARPARRMRGKCPAVAPSSVTFGDSFPPEGEAFRAVYPLGYAAGMAATGGIYAVPYKLPVMLLQP